jgi:hypothetical protein
VLVQFKRFQSALPDQGRGLGNPPFADPLKPRCRRIGEKVRKALTLPEVLHINTSAGGKIFRLRLKKIGKIKKLNQTKHAILL